jgi:hypothetical protein
VYEAIAVAAKLESQITVMLPDVICFLHAKCETSVHIHVHLVSVYGEHVTCSIFDPTQDGNTVFCKRYKANA